MNKTVRLRVALLVSSVMMLFLPGIYSKSKFARLVDPPPRRSLWRLGYPTPKYTNDSAPVYTRQTFVRDSSLELCGPPGKISQNGLKQYIVQQYIQGIPMEVKVTKSFGIFGTTTFALCDISDGNIISEECFQENVLNVEKTEQMATSKRRTNETMLFTLSPPKITCEHCVLQWKYTINRPSCPGCKPLYEFIGCADIAVKDPKEFQYMNVMMSKRQKRQATFPGGEIPLPSEALSSNLENVPVFSPGGPGVAVSHPTNQATNNVHNTVVQGNSVAGNSVYVPTNTGGNALSAQNSGFAGNLNSDSTSSFSVDSSLSALLGGDTRSVADQNHRSTVDTRTNFDRTANRFERGPSNAVTHSRVSWSSSSGNTGVGDTEFNQAGGVLNRETTSQKLGWSSTSNSSPKTGPIGNRIEGVPVGSSFDNNAQWSVRTDSSNNIINNAQNIDGNNFNQFSTSINLGGVNNVGSSQNQLSTSKTKFGFNQGTRQSQVIPNSHISSGNRQLISTTRVRSGNEMHGESHPYDQTLSTTGSQDRAVNTLERSGLSADRPTPSRTITSNSKTSATSFSTEPLSSNAFNTGNPSLSNSNLGGTVINGPGLESFRGFSGFNQRHMSTSNSQNSNQGQLQNKVGDNQIISNQQLVSDNILDNRPRDTNQITDPTTNNRLNMQGDGTGSEKFVYVQEHKQWTSSSTSNSDGRGNVIGPSSGPNNPDKSFYQKITVRSDGSSEPVVDVFTNTNSRLTDGNTINSNQFGESSADGINAGHTLLSNSNLGSRSVFNTNSEQQTISASGTPDGVRTGSTSAKQPSIASSVHKQSNVGTTVRGAPDQSINTNSQWSSSTTSSSTFSATTINTIGSNNPDRSGSPSNNQQQWTSSSNAALGNDRYNDYINFPPGRIIPPDTASVVNIVDNSKSHGELHNVNNVMSRPTVVQGMGIPVGNFYTDFIDTKPISVNRYTNTMLSSKTNKNKNYDTNSSTKSAVARDNLSSSSSSIGSKLNNEGNYFRGFTNGESNSGNMILNQNANSDGFSSNAQGTMNGGRVSGATANTQDHKKQASSNTRTSSTIFITSSTNSDGSLQSQSYNEQPSTEGEIRDQNISTRKADLKITNSIGNNEYDSSNNQASSNVDQSNSVQNNVQSSTVGQNLNTFGSNFQTELNSGSKAGLTNSQSGLRVGEINTAKNNNQQDQSYDGNTKQNAFETQSTSNSITQTMGNTGSVHQSPKLDNSGKQSLNDLLFYQNPNAAFTKNNVNTVQSISKTSSTLDSGNRNAAYVSGSGDVGTRINQTPTKRLETDKANVNPQAKIVQGQTVDSFSSSTTSQTSDYIINNQIANNQENIKANTDYSTTMGSGSVFVSDGKNAKLLPVGSVSFSGENPSIIKSGKNSDGVGASPLMRLSEFSSVGSQKSAASDTHPGTQSSIIGDISTYAQTPNTVLHGSVTTSSYGVNLSGNRAEETHSMSDLTIGNNAAYRKDPNNVSTKSGSSIISNDKTLFSDMSNNERSKLDLSNNIFTNSQNGNIPNIAKTSASHVSSSDSQLSSQLSHVSPGSSVLSMDDTLFGDPSFQVQPTTDLSSTQGISTINSDTSSISSSDPSSSKTRNSKTDSSYISTHIISNEPGTNSNALKNDDTYMSRLSSDTSTVINHSTSQHVESTVTSSTSESSTTTNYNNLNFDITSNKPSTTLDVSYASGTNSQNNAASNTFSPVSDSSIILNDRNPSLDLLTSKDGSSLRDDVGTVVSSTSHLTGAFRTDSKNNVGDISTSSSDSLSQSIDSILNVHTSEFGTNTNIESNNPKSKLQTIQRATTLHPDASSITSTSNLQTNFLDTTLHGGNAHKVPTKLVLPNNKGTNIQKDSAAHNAPLSLDSSTVSIDNILNQDSSTTAFRSSSQASGVGDEAHKVPSTLDSTTYSGTNVMNNEPPNIVSPSFDSSSSGNALHRGSLSISSISDSQTSVTDESNIAPSTSLVSTNSETSSQHNTAANDFALTSKDSSKVSDDNSLPIAAAAFSRSNFLDTTLHGGIAASKVPSKLDDGLNKLISKSDASRKSELSSQSKSASNLTPLSTDSSTRSGDITFHTDASSLSQSTLDSSNLSSDGSQKSYALDTASSTTKSSILSEVLHSSAIKSESINTQSSNPIITSNDDKPTQNESPDGSNYILTSTTDDTTTQNEISSSTSTINAADEGNLFVGFGSLPRVQKSYVDATGKSIDETQDNFDQSVNSLKAAAGNLESAVINESSENKPVSTKMSSDKGKNNVISDDGSKLNRNDETVILGLITGNLKRRNSGTVMRSQGEQSHKKSDITTTDAQVNDINHFNGFAAENDKSNTGRVQNTQADGDMKEITFATMSKANVVGNKDNAGISELGNQLHVEDNQMSAFNIKDNIVNDIADVNLVPPPDISLSSTKIFTENGGLLLPRGYPVTEGSNTRQKPIDFPSHIDHEDSISNMKSKPDTDSRTSLQTNSRIENYNQLYKGFDSLEFGQRNQRGPETNRHSPYTPGTMRTFLNSFEHADMRQPFNERQWRRIQAEKEIRHSKGLSGNTFMLHVDPLHDDSKIPLTDNDMRQMRKNKKSPNKRYFDDRLHINDDRRQDDASTVNNEFVSSENVRLHNIDKETSLRDNQNPIETNDNNIFTGFGFYSFDNTITNDKNSNIENKEFVDESLSKQASDYKQSTKDNTDNTIDITSTTNNNNDNNNNANPNDAFSNKASYQYSAKDKTDSTFKITTTTTAATNSNKNNNMNTDLSFSNQKFNYPQPINDNSDNNVQDRTQGYTTVSTHKHSMTVNHEVKTTHTTSKQIHGDEIGRFTGFGSYGFQRAHNDILKNSYPGIPFDTKLNSENLLSKHRKQLSEIEIPRDLNTIDRHNFNTVNTVRTMLGAPTHLNSVDANEAYTFNGFGFDDIQNTNMLADTNIYTNTGAQESSDNLPHLFGQHTITGDTNEKHDDLSKSTFDPSNEIGGFSGFETLSSHESKNLIGEYQLNSDVSQQSTSSIQSKEAINQQETQKTVGKSIDEPDRYVNAVDTSKIKTLSKSENTQTHGYSGNYDNSNAIFKDDNRINAKDDKINARVNSGDEYSVVFIGDNLESQNLDKSKTVGETAHVTSSSTFTNKQLPSLQSPDENIEAPQFTSILSGRGDDKASISPLYLDKQLENKQEVNQEISFETDLADLGRALPPVADSRLDLPVPDVPSTLKYNSFSTSTADYSTQTSLQQSDDKISPISIGNQDSSDLSDINNLSISKTNYKTLEKLGDMQDNLLMGSIDNQNQQRDSQFWTDNHIGNFGIHDNGINFVSTSSDMKNNMATKPMYTDTTVPAPGDIQSNTVLTSHASDINSDVSLHTESRASSFGDIPSNTVLASHLSDKNSDGSLRTENSASTLGDIQSDTFLASRVSDANTDNTLRDDSRTHTFEEAHFTSSSPQFITDSNSSPLPAEPPSKLLTDANFFTQFNFVSTGSTAKPTTHYPTQPNNLNAGQNVVDRQSIKADDKTGSNSAIVDQSGYASQTHNIVTTVTTRTDHTYRQETADSWNNGQVLGPGNAGQISGTDNTGKVSGNDNTGQVSGTDNTRQVSGTDNTRQVSGTDNTRQVSGTDNTRQVSGTDNTRQVSGTANTGQVRGTDNTSLNYNQDTTMSSQSLFNNEPSIIDTIIDEVTKDSNNKKGTSEGIVNTDKNTNAGVVDVYTDNTNSASSATSTFGQSTHASETSNINLATDSTSGNVADQDLYTLNNGQTSSVNGNIVDQNLYKLTNNQVGSVSGSIADQDLYKLKNTQTGSVSGNIADQDLYKLENTKTGSVSRNIANQDLYKLENTQTGSISGNIADQDLYKLENTQTGSVSGNIADQDLYKLENTQTGSVSGNIADQDVYNIKSTQTDLGSLTHAGQNLNIQDESNINQNLNKMEGTTTGQFSFNSETFRTDTNTNYIGGSDAGQNLDNVLGIASKTSNIGKTSASVNDLNKQQNYMIGTINTQPMSTSHNSDNFNTVISSDKADGHGQITTSGVYDSSATDSLNSKSDSAISTGEITQTDQHSNSQLYNMNQRGFINANSITGAEANIVNLRYIEDTTPTTTTIPAQTNQNIHTEVTASRTTANKETGIHRNENTEIINGDSGTTYVEENLNIQTLGNDSISDVNKNSNKDTSAISGQANYIDQTTNVNTATHSEQMNIIQTTQQNIDQKNYQDKNSISNENTLTKSNAVDTTSGLATGTETLGYQLLTSNDLQNGNNKQDSSLSKIASGQTLNDKTMGKQVDLSIQKTDSIGNGQTGKNLASLSSQQSGKTNVIHEVKTDTATNTQTSGVLHNGQSGVALEDLKSNGLGANVNSKGVTFNKVVNNNILRQQELDRQQLSLQKKIEFSRSLLDNILLGTDNGNNENYLFSDGSFRFDTSNVNSLFPTLTNSGDATSISNINNNILSTSEFSKNINNGVDRGSGNTFITDSSNDKVLSAATANKDPLPAVKLPSVSSSSGVTTSAANNFFTTLKPSNLASTSIFGDTSSNQFTQNPMFGGSQAILQSGSLSAIRNSLATSTPGNTETNQLLRQSNNDLQTSQVSQTTGPNSVVNGLNNVARTDTLSGDQTSGIETYSEQEALRFATVLNGGTYSTPPPTMSTQPSMILSNALNLNGIGNDRSTSLVSSGSFVTDGRLITSPVIFSDRLSADQLSQDLSLTQNSGNLQMEGNQLGQSNQQFQDNQQGKGNQQMQGNLQLQGNQQFQVNQQIQNSQQIQGIQVGQSNQQIQNNQQGQSNQQMQGNLQVQSNQQVQNTQQIQDNQRIQSNQHIQGDQQFQSNQHIQNNQQIQDNQQIQNNQHIQGNQQFQQDQGNSLQNSIGSSSSRSLNVETTHSSSNQINLMNIGRTEQNTNGAVSTNPDATETGHMDRRIAGFYKTSSFTIISGRTAQTVCPNQSLICGAKGEFSLTFRSNLWCINNCLGDPSTCQNSRCNCHCIPSGITETDLRNSLASLSTKTESHQSSVTRTRSEDKSSNSPSLSSSINFQQSLLTGAPPVSLTNSFVFETTPRPTTAPKYPQTVGNVLPSGRVLVCKGRGVFSEVDGMVQWCETVCGRQLNPVCATETCKCYLI